jgi:hypothetical protein
MVTPNVSAFLCLDRLNKRPALSLNELRVNFLPFEAVSERRYTAFLDRAVLVLSTSKFICAVLLDAFRSMNSPAAQAVVATCVASASPGFQAIGVAGGLERGTPETVHRLAQLWPAINADSDAPDVVCALGDSWRDTAPAGVQQLAALATATTSGSEFRAAAVRALASIHTQEALPFLATLLNSSDPDEQERAVYGLSAFANGCPIQTNDNAVNMAYLQCDQPTPYRTADTIANFGFRPGPPDQEAALVSFWQAWWNDHSELH